MEGKIFLGTAMADGVLGCPCSHAAKRPGAMARDDFGQQLPLPAVACPPFPDEPCRLLRQDSR